MSINIISASAIVSKMIGYFSGDVKRINHAIKVYGLAKSIGEQENLPGEKQAVLEIAAILHDIGIKESERKYNSTLGKYQETEGPPVARMLLEEFHLPETFINRVCFLIGNHHTYTKIDDVDFQILVEADFLVNIFEDSINKELIKNLREKYFKTKAGQLFLDSMYL